MLQDIPDEQLLSVLDETVANLLWEADLDEPPIDAFALAKRIGLVIATDRRMPSRGRFVRLSSRGRNSARQGTIVINDADRPERKQWAVAHEIGESLAHCVFERLGVRPKYEDAAREFVANRLAQCLLLPRQWFTLDGRDTDWDLFALKEIYTTASHELIARRMLEMRPSIVITVCDQGHVKWRRGNTSLRPPRLQAEEMDAWQKSHVTGLPVEEALDPSATTLERVRVWPIHEPGWKREILRTDIAECM